MKALTLHSQIQGLCASYCPCPVLCVHCTLPLWAGIGHADACRYLSHFRAIHRGAYFAQLRTTTVRKLLPESWGFLCPVHTPDGSPCGLLNHFTAACQVVERPPDSPEDVQYAISMVCPTIMTRHPSSPTQAGSLSAPVLSACICLSHSRRPFQNLQP